MISDDFKIAIKLSEEPAYKIAQRAGVDPNFLSKAMRGIIKVKPGDERVVRIGKFLGLDKSECFKKNISEGDFLCG